MLEGVCGWKNDEIDHWVNLQRKHFDNPFFAHDNPSRDIAIVISERLRPQLGPLQTLQLCNRLDIAMQSAELTTTDLAMIRQSVVSILAEYGGTPQHLSASFS